MNNIIKQFLALFWSQPRKPLVGKFKGPLSHIPRNRNEVISVYGNPGQFKASKKFKKQNMSTYRGLPGQWNKSSGKLYMHDLIAPYFIEALRRAEINGSLSAIRQIGCYSYRHKQHNPKLGLSYHSWGIAVDVDQRHNKVVRFAPGKYPVPWSDIWIENWPRGISQEFVEAMESVGFLWGGRWKRFCDPMHFQLKH